MSEVSQKCKLRRANSVDFESIFDFLCSLQGRNFNRENLKELFIYNLKNADNIYLIAEVDNHVVGYLSCHIQILLHHEGKVAEIQEVFVEPSYRSLGIGKLMIDEIKNITKEKGALQLEVTTRKIREKAIQFYIRESFDDSHKKLVYHF